MSSHSQLIETFYSALQNRDIDTMLACYHEDVSFSDPIFTDLKGWRARAMWQMLVNKGEDMEIKFHSIQADETSATAQWQANYTFSKTGRPIQNHIQANFTFQDGKIISHRDNFSLWKWIRMAMGFQGLLTGWLPAVQNKIRQESQKGLTMFIKRNRLDPDAPARKKKNQ